MPSSAGPSLRVWFLAALLLAAHAALALSAVFTKSVTTDEIFHVTGGYLFNRFGDFRIHPDNGVLPQRWQALPAGWLDARPPPQDGNPLWRTSSVHGISHQFFYDSGNDHGPFLAGARVMSLAFSLGCGVLVFVWTRRLAGDVAGFVALGLWAFSPTFLAHGPLATSDVCASLFLTASVGLFWWQLPGGAGRVALSTLVFGGACLSKYSAVLLLPVFAVLLVLHWVSTPAADRRAGRLLAGVAIHGLGAWALIWAAFNFRYSAFAPGLPPADHFVRSWEWMIGRMGFPGPVVNFCREWRLLPEAFLFGFTHTYVGAQERAAFLLGEYRTTGWVEFFPLAFLWKSTPAELGAVLLAALGAGWHWRQLGPWLRRLSPLLLWAAVYGAAALTSKLNIGHRHLLPLYPALFIVGGVAVAHVVTPPALRRGLATVLVAGQFMSAAAIHPHYLAYFNAFAGGPENGWRRLVDSSLDWGQELPDLARWLREHNAGPEPARVYLAYFGSGRPAYYGINATSLPSIGDTGVIHPYHDMQAGLYAVSATMLQTVYMPVRGDYRPEYEAEYQALKMLTPLFQAYWKDPEARAWALTQITEEDLLRHWQRFDALRFSRLATYLRHHRPEAVLGHALFIHRLTDDELDRLLNRRFSDWADLVAQTAASLDGSRPD